MELQNTERPWWDSLLGNFSTFLKLGKWILASWVIIAIVFFFIGMLYSVGDCTSPCLNG